MATIDKVKMPDGTIMNITDAAAVHALNTGNVNQILVTDENGNSVWTDNLQLDVCYVESNQSLKFTKGGNNNE